MNHNVAGNTALLDPYQDEHHAAGADLDPNFVDDEFNRIVQAEFEQPSSVTVRAVGAVAIEASADGTPTGNWAAVGRARLPDSMVIRPDAHPLTEALNADVTRVTKNANIANYSVRYTQEAAQAMRQAMEDARHMLTAEDDKDKKKKRRRSLEGIRPGTY